MASPSPAVAAPITTWLPGTGADEDLLAQLAVGHDELRALYAGLFDAGVDPVTLDLCRLRLATLIGSRADLAVRDPRAVAAGLDDETVGALAHWPKSDRFTDAQRAALAYTEQFVIDAHGFNARDEAELKRHYTPAQLATLTIAVAAFDALARVRALLTVDPSRTSVPTTAARIGVALG
jgi:alkylhydroperoxidase family enzyme